MSLVGTYFSSKIIPYTGKELRSHFVRNAFDIEGDAAAAFLGPADVKISEMVDLEDVRDEAPIFSPKMVHVLVENFGLGLTEGVCRQRLLGRLAADLLRESGVEDVAVRGDDLFVDERKASVSIATRSLVSVLIHFGMNVETEGTPVPTWGLAERDVDPPKFAQGLLGRYAAEIDAIHRASTKVRGVP